MKLNPLAGAIILHSREKGAGSGCAVNPHVREKGFP